MNPSKKNDLGKPPMAYITHELLSELALVRAYGAKVYGLYNNRETGFEFTRSASAAMRHLAAFMNGEDNDPESGLTHLGHAIASLEQLLYDYRNHSDMDDRFKGSN